MFRSRERRVQSVDFSPNGQLVSASFGGTVCVWNTRDGSARVFAVECLIFWSVRFSPNGRFVVAGNSDGLRIWDVRTGRLLKNSRNGLDIEVPSGVWRS